MSVRIVSLVYRIASYIVIGGITLMLGMVIGGNQSSSAMVKTITPAAENSQDAGSITADPGGGNPGVVNPFVEVIEKVKPTVVQVTTTKVVKYRYWDPFDNPFEDIFPEFFGQRRERKRKPYREGKKKQEGLGSGFIIDKEGHILTNYHVIKDVDEIQVKLLHEKKVYEAKVIGEPDASTDIALIKIEPRHPLTVAKLGDSDKIRVGEWALAIGNPFGLEETLTAGVISAKGRSGFSGMPRYQDFIQTDASINLGNSGGPLMNIQGEVIGINTFIVSPYVAQGLGFAIPINMAKSVYKKILEHGRVVRGYLGIIPQDVDSAMAKLWNLPGEKGVVISDVEEGTPASRGGLKVQDVIIEFDGKEVTGEEQFRRMVADTSVDKKVKVRVIRNGREEILTVTIGELPSEARLAGKEEEKLELGILVREITPAMVERYNLKETHGVIVIDVEGGSAADGKIEPADIIKKINNREIENKDDYLSALGKIEAGEDIVLHIRRGKYTLFVVIKAE